MRAPSPTVVAPFLLLAALCAPAAAQYKWFGPNGQITYSDLPPPPGMQGAPMKLGNVDRPDDAPAPSALRAAATKFPVLLYTTAECAPCQQARAHLNRRGVPFTERTVKTAADAEAFKQLGFGDNSFPTVTVGKERSVGLEIGEWDRLLDAAGYPRTSMLPPSYKAPPARALAAAAPTPKNTARTADAGSNPADVVDGEATGRTPAARPRPVAPQAAGVTSSPAPGLRF
jgi:glutaredoxin